MKEEAWCVKDSMFENEKYHKWDGRGLENIIPFAQNLRF
jgi:hypothetical protein